MEFFIAAVAVLKTMTTGIGAGMIAWGLVNLAEGYGGENPASKNQGLKQCMAGASIVIIASTLIPMLATLFQ